MNRKISKLKLLSIVLVVAIFFINISYITVFAADDIKDSKRGESIVYIALGDSIPKGYAPSGLEVTSYVDEQGKYLGTKPINKAVNGMTSTELLSILNSGIYDSELAKANVITVTIGSNDLLGPFMAALAESLNINETTPNLAENIANKIKHDVRNLIPNLGGIKANLESNATIDKFQAASKTFSINWPTIINTLKIKAPKAKIMATNIYNPYCGANIPGVFDLQGYGDKFIKEMNEVIANGTGYETVDIYTAFSKPGFTNVNIKNFYFDPHPNQLGHDTIFELIKTKAVPMENSEESIKEEKPIGIALMYKLLIDWLVKVF